MHFPVFALFIFLSCSAFGQVDAAIAKVQAALSRSLTLKVEAIEADELQRPDKDRATLTQDLARTQKLYAECLRAHTVVGKTADQRIMPGVRYWELWGNTVMSTDVLAVLEKRSGRAKQVAGVIKRAMPILEMETDAAERILWLQRFAVMENALRTIAANPHNANSARFDLKRHLPLFEQKTTAAKTP